MEAKRKELQEFVNRLIIEEDSVVDEETLSKSFYVDEEYVDVMYGMLKSLKNQQENSLDYIETKYYTDKRAVIEEMLIDLSEVANDVRRAFIEKNNENSSQYKIEELKLTMLKNFLLLSEFDKYSPSRMKHDYEVDMEYTFNCIKSMAREEEDNQMYAYINKLISKYFSYFFRNYIEKLHPVFREYYDEFEFVTERTRNGLTIKLRRRAEYSYIDTPVLYIHRIEGPSYKVTANADMFNDLCRYRINRSTDVNVGKIINAFNEFEYTFSGSHSSTYIGSKARKDEDIYYAINLEGKEQVFVMDETQKHKFIDYTREAFEGIFKAIYEFTEENIDAVKTALSCNY